MYQSEGAKAGRAKYGTTMENGVNDVRAVGMRAAELGKQAGWTVESAFGENMGKVFHVALSGGSDTSVTSKIEALRTGKISVTAKVGAGFSGPKIFVVVREG